MRQAIGGDIGDDRLESRGNAVGGRELHVDHCRLVDWTADAADHRARDSLDLRFHREQRVAEEEEAAAEEAAAAEPEVIAKGKAEEEGEEGEEKE